ncbi:MAG: hypothetical protein GF315_10190 [candidate division Zixibacteria bacterium]|nr:hypothetical protein [candidate division Zixibacteria bacterium]
MEQVIPRPPVRDFVIADFEEVEDLDWIEPVHGEYALTGRHPVSGQYSLAFNYEIAKYPGMEFWHIPRRWDYFDSLRFMVINPTEQNIKLVFRLDDQNSTWKPETYYFEEQQLSPGINRIIIPLSKIQEKIDTTNLKRMILSLKQPQIAGKIYIDDIVLTVDDG